MVEPISDPAYWKRRLETASELHHSVFRCPLDRWRRIEAKHRQILAKWIGQTDAVLDAGCGYGRLLDLLPPTWTGPYVGVDLSPDMIARARQREAAGRSFYVADLRHLRFLQDGFFDWAILISVRPMVLRNLGEEEWQKMEAEIRRVARRLLYLEYDEKDGGSVE